MSRSLLNNFYAKNAQINNALINNLKVNNLRTQNTLNADNFNIKINSVNGVLKYDNNILVSDINVNNDELNKYGILDDIVTNINIIFDNLDKYLFYKTKIIAKTNNDENIRLIGYSKIINNNDNVNIITELTETNLSKSDVFTLTYFEISINSNNYRETSIINPIINTLSGKIRGLLNILPIQIPEIIDIVPFEEQKSLFKFTSIPYAEPPINDLRFKPPVPIKNWDNIYDANMTNILCSQILNPTSLSGIFIENLENKIFSEDCLYLDIFTSDLNAKNPVIIQIHGGGFNVGSKNMIPNDFTFTQDNIVYVSINYRLNIFGFIAFDELLEESKTTGNYGILDQILALKWIKNNIEFFGGDPNNITLLGESAGGSSIETMLASPLVNNLFNRIIDMSGYLQFLTKERISKLTYDGITVEPDNLSVNYKSHIYKKLYQEFFNEEFNIKTFKNKTTDELLKFSEHIEDKGYSYIPTKDDYVLSIDSTKEFLEPNLNNRNIDILVTNTSNEGNNVLYPDDTYSYDKNLSESNQTVSKQVDDLYNNPITQQDKNNAGSNLLSDNWIIRQLNFAKNMENYILGNIHNVIIGFDSYLFGKNIKGIHGIDITLLLTPLLFFVLGRSDSKNDGRLITNTILLDIRNLVINFARGNSIQLSKITDEKNVNLKYLRNGEYINNSFTLSESDSIIDRKADDLDKIYTNNNIKIYSS